jgi:hypothetical protein
MSGRHDCVTFDAALSDGSGAFAFQRPSSGAATGTVRRRHGARQSLLEISAPRRVAPSLREEAEGRRRTGRPPAPAAGVLRETNALFNEQALLDCLGHEIL